MTHCSPLSTETTFATDADLDGPKAIALRLGVRAQLSLVNAMSAVQSSDAIGSVGAVWWLDEALAEITAMRAALTEQRSAA